MTLKLSSNNMIVAHICVLLMACIVSQAATDLKNEHSMDPDFYRCPFRLFDAGKPVTSELGEVMYCDVDGVRCPNYYFCSAGYQDGRAVCCHILGV